MSNSSEYPDWLDDEENAPDDESLNSRNFPYDQDDDLSDDPSDIELIALNSFEKSMFENKVIRTFVRNAHEFGGIGTLLEVVNQIERQMGWKMEIIADRDAVDDYMFYRHETFDEDLWSHYTNADRYEDLVRQTAFLSTRMMGDFIDGYSKGPNFKRSAMAFVRRFVWKVYSKL